MGCAECGEPVQQPAGRGRPRSYCSTACRRGRERRLAARQRSLARLRVSAVQWRALADAHPRVDYAATAARLEAELVRRTAEGGSGDA